jgi:hypothetical protein
VDDLGSVPGSAIFLSTVLRLAGGGGGPLHWMQRVHSLGVEVDHSYTFRVKVRDDGTMSSWHS